MKSPAAAHPPLSADQSVDLSEHHDQDPTPTDTPRRPQSLVQPPLPSRPQLLRASPGRAPDPSPITVSTDEESSSSQDTASTDLPSQNATASPSVREHRTPKLRRKTTVPLTDEEKLLKLRDEINAKLLLHQQRRRNNNHHHNVSTTLAAKRVSPIREEEGAIISPTLNAAFASPAASAAWPPSNLSHGSSDSSRTVRGTAHPTPGESQRPLRTPSYPFPRIGTPRSTPGSVHQSFLNLSPTVAATQDPDVQTPRKRSIVMPSNGSTPSANEYAFLPQGTVYEAAASSAFPTPNLYDMVLQLNSEPGIEQWWATVSNLMHDHFKADRAALFMPLDPTDLENVPWGQKATFTMTGLEQFVSPQTLRKQTSLATATPTASNFRETSSALDSILKDVQMQKLHPERLRPAMPKRHSYAGNGRETKETFTEPSSRPQRPAGPQRMATHAPTTSSGIAISKIDGSSATPTAVRHSSATDPNFSSIGGEDLEIGPHAEVFSTLRPLDSELHPLIEVAGVNRVLERGRLVTVTRDYSSDKGSSTNGVVSPREDDLDASDITPRDSAAPPTKTAHLAYDPWAVLRREYDEYEQHPSSPWAQSPAPSPAIQANEEVNPFFPSEQEQVEQSFDSENDPRDYSKLGQVEAIGVERASTVIHIPLVHPTLSQPMQSLSMQAESQTRPGLPRRSDTLDLERKAPIAVLSVLSNTVPYPPNLLQTLELFGPHLATSFAIAQQFSSTHYQAVSIRHRRTASGRRISTAPMVIQPASLEELVNAELERPPGSVSAGSMTSPSDYSGRSKTSPSGSMAGTPAWDPQYHSWASRSQAGTPAHVPSENIDSYFDAKKSRTAQRKGSTTGIPTTAASKPSASVSESAVSRSDPKRTASRPLSAQEPVPSRAPEVGTARPSMQHTYSHFSDAKVAKRHSLLHSYGADFESSFGNIIGSTEPSTPGHARKSSYPEDMPPPSERLLRTIIDSVPVQIFTAKPDTGSLSWVNSKFIIYRGQEPGHILSDPWLAIHPEDRTEFLAAWHRSLRTAQQLQQKVRLERFDKTYRWFYVRAAPLKDKRQKIVHWIGTMMDFHEQHNAEQNAARQQETAASEAKYRALANSSPQIVFAVSRSRGVIFCNSRWLHYSGQTEQEALGLGFMDHVHPEDISKCRLPTFEKGSRKPNNVPTSVPLGPRRTPSNSMVSSASSETEKTVTSPDVSSPSSPMPQRKLSELADTGILKVTRDADGRPSYSTEVRLKSREGDYRWHLVRVLLAEPLLQNDDDEETWYGTCTDINDHKTLERDLKETMDEKTRFLSNMSHEIRTPLNGITGMVNFLIDSSLTAEQMEHVNIIRASTEGLRGLINDILDLSKAEAGMIQLNMDWLYIRALIEEVNDLTSAMAIDKGLDLNYIVEEDVPLQVKGDRFRLRQILLNVVGNAIKFTQRGEVFVRCSTVSVDEELSEDELFIKFEVIDTGRGFNEKEAEFLFKRFSQIDGSSTRQHGGTGLGLVISRQLAQLHGGDMSAKGVPDKGSTFTFFVKASLPTKEDQPPLPLATPGIPILPMASPLPTPTLGSEHAARQDANISQAQTEFERRISPKSVPRTPFESDRESPALSSASSDPSVRSVARTGSHASQGSSSSSLPTDSGLSESPMKLALPPDLKSPRIDMSESLSTDMTSSTDPQRPIKATQPSKTPLLAPSRSLPAPLYSILVVCPLKYSREATVQHIEKTLPSHIPHQITAQEDPKTCLELLRGGDPVVFTHIVISLRDIGEIIKLMEVVVSSPAHATTNIVIITDLAQRRSLMQQAPDYDYEALNDTRRVRFVFKPLKPSRLAVVFDPQKEREMSFDRNQDSAQQVAVNQKQVFEELSRRLGNKEKRVLLVEDNHVNQMVILKFLAKARIKVDTVQDGVQCTDKVFAQPPGHYAIILCDLHMPNKDGYQTCKEIRKWERSHRYSHLPIIALSANVLGDVYQKCVDAGFNSYMTKPVDFKELSLVLMMFMDPNDPNLPHEFMKMKGSGGGGRKKG